MSRTRNKYNYGHVEGQVAREPTVRSLKAFVCVTVFVMTGEDPDDRRPKSQSANKRVVPVQVFVRRDDFDERSLRQVRVGADVSSDFSLKTVPMGTTGRLFMNVVAENIEIDGEEFPQVPVAEPDYDDYDVYEETYKVPKGTEYDFLPDDELGEWAENGDRDAWYEGHERGLW